MCYLQPQKLNGWAAAGRIGKADSTEVLCLTGALLTSLHPKTGFQMLSDNSKDPHFIIWIFAESARLT